VNQRNGGDGVWIAYRCKSCDRYYTILTGTVFSKMRQRPSKIVLILCGIAQGQSTARLSRELGIARSRMHEIRQQVQQNLYHTLLAEPMDDGTLETDELYLNAGKEVNAISTPMIRPGAVPTSAPDMALTTMIDHQFSR
jgi:hypothetical protein